MKFINQTSIVLYTALNRTNAELLKVGKYSKFIKAYEYSDLVYQSEAEKVLTLSYDVSNMYDTLQPRAYHGIKKMIKDSGHNSSEITDDDVVKGLLRNHTGVRVHCIDTSDKCYKNTLMIFGKSNLIYIVKPEAVKVIGEKDIR